jgi:hypothetical protein
MVTSAENLQCDYHNEETVLTSVLPLSTDGYLDELRTQASQ